MCRRPAPTRGGYIKDIEYHNIEIGHLWREAICFTMGHAGDSYNPKAGVNVQTKFAENLCMENVTFR